jgi:hypothetical protein
VKTTPAVVPVPADVVRGLASNPWALGALIVGNLLPLAGVAFWGWRTYDLMVLYWLENGVVGLFTIAKMVSARPPGGSAWSSIVLVPFFLVHYGLFWSVHGTFVGVLFGGGLMEGGAFGAGAVPGFGPSLGLPVLTGYLTVPLLALFLSHGVSFVTNYLGRGVDRALTPRELMAQPYGRVVLLHVTILAGGFAAMMLGGSVVALFLLVALKTAVDVRAHLREHSRAVERVSSATSSIG